MNARKSTRAIIFRPSRCVASIYAIHGNSYWHPIGTAKMGRDDLSVVDGALWGYGIDNLRIADASIMPQVTSGNIMTPCGHRGTGRADAHGLPRALTLVSPAHDHRRALDCSMTSR